MSDTDTGGSENPGEAADAISQARDEADRARVLARFTVAEALGDAGFGDILVLSHEAAARALTESRREILETLATADFESQGKLARHLGRDPGNVGRDIDVLVDEGLVDRVQNGRAKKPVLTHDTYVVEPIVSTTSPTV
jgi:predicted transcriptional regulator